MTTDPWMADADDARVLRLDDQYGPIGLHRDTLAAFAPELFRPVWPEGD